MKLEESSMGLFSIRLCRLRAICPYLILFGTIHVFVAGIPAQEIPAEKAQDKITVAVLDLAGTGITTLETETLSNHMRTELMETGLVSSVDVERIRETVEAAGFSDGKCESDDCALQIGKLLGVSHVVIGSVAKVDDGFDLNCRMLKVETGEVQDLVTRQYQGDTDGLVTSIQRMMWDVVGSTPPPDRFPEELAQDTTGENRWMFKARTMANNLWNWTTTHEQAVLAGGAVVAAVFIVAILKSDDSNADHIGKPPDFPDDS